MMIMDGPWKALWRQCVVTRIYIQNLSCNAYFDIVCVFRVRASECCCNAHSLPLVVMYVCVGDDCREVSYTMPNVYFFVSQEYICFSNSTCLAKLGQAVLIDSLLYILYQTRSHQ